MAFMIFSLIMLITTSRHPMSNQAYRAIPVTQAIRIIQVVILVMTQAVPFTRTHRHLRMTLEVFQCPLMDLRSPLGHR